MPLASTEYAILAFVAMRIETDGLPYSRPIALLTRSLPDEWNQTRHAIARGQAIKQAVLEV